MPGPSPTSRTLQALKADPDCLRAERVEQWVSTSAHVDVVAMVESVVGEVFRVSSGPVSWAALQEEIVRRFRAAFPTGGFRRDLFSFIDVVALTTRGILGIQATTGPNAAARIAKIHDGTTGAFEWLSCRGLVEVWAWRKVSVGKRWLWRPRVVPLTLDDLRRKRGAERLHDPPQDAGKGARTARVPSA